GVADRHLEQVLQDGSGTVVQLPVRRPAGGWEVRRRVVAVALAAALVLAPATIASAAALPGQAMYPFKLAIEQLRIASVQWSSGREAGERTRVAHERLQEFQSLVNLKMFAQVPGALKALEQAVVAAQAAVAEAQQEGERVGTAEARLTQVRATGGQVAEQVWVAAAKGSIDLTGGTREAVQAAVQQSQDVLPPPAPRETVPTDGTPTPTTGDSPPNTAPSETTSAPVTSPQTTSAPATSPQTTSPPPTSAPTTNPPTSTNPPTTDTAAPETAGVTPGGGDQAGAAERAAEPDVPPTTAPATP
ncbi:MAG TPA: hypothetical protein VJ735_19835, partial [Actinomycetes bacterium]|nr:hypothetical protein [Actinomycetes bacterium]